MKKLLAIILIAATCLTVGGRTYKIKYINTPTITIGGKKLSVGDKFDSKSKISWQSDRQAMKVISDDNQIVYLSPNILAQKNPPKNLRDFLTGERSANVRGGTPISVADHRELFEACFVLLDSLSFDVGWKMNPSSHFYARTNNLDKNFLIDLPYDGQTTFIPREAFENLIDKIDSVTLSIYYVYDFDGPDQEIIELTDNMTLYLVPLSIDPSEL